MGGCWISAAHLSNDGIWRIAKRGFGADCLALSQPSLYSDTSLCQQAIPRHFVGVPAVVLLRETQHAHANLPTRSLLRQVPTSIMNSGP
jgi:hypothetical protein